MDFQQNIQWQNNIHTTLEETRKTNALLEQQVALMQEQNRLLLSVCRLLDGQPVR